MREGQKPPQPPNDFSYEKSGTAHFVQIFDAVNGILVRLSQRDRGFFLGLSSSECGALTV